MHALNLLSATGDDFQLRVESLQIELTDHATVSLLDQEHPRARFELLFDELEFTLGETEAARVFLGTRVSVGKEDLGRRLLDDRATDRTVEHVAGALSRQTHHTVELAPGLRAVFRSEEHTSELQSLRHLVC